MTKPERHLAGRKESPGEPAGLINHCPYCDGAPGIAVVCSICLRLGLCSRTQASIRCASASVGLRRTSGATIAIAEANLFVLAAGSGQRGPKRNTAAYMIFAFCSLTPLHRIPV